MRTRVLIAALLIAPAASAAEPTGDLARLQGTWTGLAGPKRDIPVALEIKGDKVTVDLKTPQGLKIKARGEVRVDDGARPRALDWVKFRALDGQDLPEIPAIYELKGDTLRLCNGGPNAERPTAFVPGEGALADVLVFRKAGTATR